MTSIAFVVVVDNVNVDSTFFREGCGSCGRIFYLSVRGSLRQVYRKLGKVKSDGSNVRFWLW